jgi:hypothetical protein
MMGDAMNRASRWIPLLMGMILASDHARHGAWGWALLALGLGAGWMAAWSRPWPWIPSVGLLGGVALSVLALLQSGSPLSALIASSLALLSWDRADAQAANDTQRPGTTLALLRGRRAVVVIGSGLGLGALALSIDPRLSRMTVGLLGLVALAGLRWIVRAIQRDRSRP